MLSCERALKEELRRERDKEIQLAIWTLEEETSKDKEECERAADNRCVCVCVFCQCPSGLEQNFISRLFSPTQSHDARCLQGEASEGEV